MIYSIGFWTWAANGTEGTLHEYNGHKYMHVDGNAGKMLKELCGEYPSRWACRSVKYMLPIFRTALQELTKLSAKCSYTDFINGAFITTAEIAVILKELIARCEAFPDAVLEVDW